jgi:hypothetical protein
MTFLRIVISLYLFVLSMIFSENRYPLFRIMLWMLFGKTILVTGVSSGIGARTAELASHLGAVCTEDPIRVYRMTESAKLARWSASFWPSPFKSKSRLEAENATLRHFPVYPRQQTPRSQACCAPESHPHVFAMAMAPSED